MAKQVQKETDVEELLDTVTQTMDRLKTLYEQYFMGIQKQAPSFIHNDLERKLRDLAQMQLRNTGMRYRLATLQQKFGSYNSYWRRTLRQIENGTYARQLQKVGRDAVRTGADIPEEILAAMPKRMREQVLRDRDQALSIAKRRQQVAEGDGENLPPEVDADFIAMIKEPTEVRRKLKSTDGAHLLDGGDDFDIDAFFAEVEQGEPAPGAPQIARSRTSTRQPSTRNRPTTTGDLIRSGTRPDIKLDIPTRAETQPGTGSMRADTEPGMSPLPKSSTPPPSPVRAQTQQGVSPNQTQPMGRVGNPPPIPGRALDPEDRQTTKQAPLPRAATAVPDRATGPQMAIDPVTGLPRAPTGQPRAPTVPGQPRAPTVPGGTGPQQSVNPTGPTDLHHAQPRAATNPQARAAVPRPDPTRATGPSPAIPTGRATGANPVVPRPADSSAPTDVPASVPRVTPPRSNVPTASMSSQNSRPNPIVPGSAAARGSVPVESMAGPFPREKLSTPSGGMPSIPKPIPKPSTAIPAIPKPEPVIAAGDTGSEPAVIVTKTPAAGSALTRAATARTPHVGVPASRTTPAQGVPAMKPAPQKPPPGMTDADVNALYAKYVKAKEMVGEKIGPGEHNKLLKTINAQAPKIMEQYKAKGVDFSVVVKDNQVIIRAKPKT